MNRIARLTRKQKWMIIITALILLIGTVAYANRSSIAFWGFDTFIADDVEKTLEKTYQPLEGRTPKPVGYEAELQPFSILLLGVDARDNERGRSDTMIYTVVRPQDGSMLMVSIPRDSYVEIPGRSQGDKITHSYAYGEAKLAVETVEQLFDTTVDHYAAINFSGFRDVIDALGGIALPIEKDLVNDDPGHEKFVVKAGQDLYNGQDALNFVRFREDAGGDVSRTGRHQVFIQSLINKASEVGQWSKIPQLVQIMGDNFKTDLTPDDMIDLGRAMLQSGNRSLYSHSLQGEGRISSSGAWYYYLNEEDLDQAKSWVKAWMDESRMKSQLPLPDAYPNQRHGLQLSAPETGK